MSYFIYVYKTSVRFSPVAEKKVFYCGHNELFQMCPNPFKGVGTNLESISIIKVDKQRFKKSNLNILFFLKIVCLKLNVK